VRRGRDAEEKLQVAASGEELTSSTFKRSGSLLKLGEEEREERSAEEVEEGRGRMKGEVKGRMNANEVTQRTNGTTQKWRQKWRRRERALKSNERARSESEEWIKVV
jgi:hypothetical protein